MSDVAIRVHNLSKRYRIGLKEESHDTFAGMLSDYVRRPAHNLRRLRRLTHFDDPSPTVNGQLSDDTIWALKDVSFEVQPGEVVGVIGRNGAGKSTLLKILSRITHPTSGRVELNGRVSSLLEVGTGFHPELTGRENIYLNGTILGMRKAEIDRKFDEIVDFSGVEKFIDTPAKRYSSGMRVRLAFSVAAHLEPEILLVDEVLAVGDAEFQKKSLGKMDEVSKGGRTVLFVSHNMTSVQALCHRGLLLKSGHLERDGEAVDVVQDYLEAGPKTGEVFFQSKVSKDSRGQFTNIRILNNHGEVIDKVPMGLGFTVELEVIATQVVRNPNFGVRLYNSLGHGIVAWRTQETIGEMPALTRGGKLFLTVDKLNILPGIYHLALGFSDGYETIDHIDDAISFEVTPRPIYPTGKLPSPRGANIYTLCDWKALYR